MEKEERERFGLISNVKVYISAEVEVIRTWSSEQ
jgi:hypothetical protein